MSGTGGKLSRSQQASQGSRSGARGPRGSVRKEGRKEADLGIEHDGAEDAGALHGVAEVVERLLVVLVGAVGEVEAGDAHPGAEQARDHVDGARRRAQRAHDLGLGPPPQHGLLPPRRHRPRRVGWVDLREEGEGGSREGREGKGEGAGAEFVGFKV